MEASTAAAADPVAAAVEPSAAASSSTNLPLPVGWFFSTDPRGKVFYYNGAGESTWTHPGLLGATSLMAGTATAPIGDAPAPAAAPALRGRGGQADEAEEENGDEEQEDGGIVDDDTFCVLCSKGEDAETMLLCDMCDRGFHTKCVTPAVDPAAIDSWYCVSCARVHERRVKDDEERLANPAAMAAAAAAAAQAKKPKKTREPEAEDDAEEEDRDDEEEEEEEDDVCAECGEAEENETLLICDDCTQSYHLECVGLDAVPDDPEWFCKACVKKRSSKRGARAAKTSRRRRRGSDDDDSDASASSFGDEDSDDGRPASARKLSKRSGIARSRRNAAVKNNGSAKDDDDDDEEEARPPAKRPRKAAKTAKDVLEANAAGEDFAKVADQPAAPQPVTERQAEAAQEQQSSAL